MQGVQCRFSLWRFTFGESSQVIHNLRPVLWSEEKSSQLPSARLLGSPFVLSRASFSIGHPTGQRQEAAAWQMAGGLSIGPLLGGAEFCAVFWEEKVMISMTV